MCSSLDGSEQSRTGEPSQKFQAYFYSFLRNWIGLLRIGKFSDCLNLVNTKSALLNNCVSEDGFCACRGEAFPVGFFFFQLEENCEAIGLIMAGKMWT